MKKRTLKTTLIVVAFLMVLAGVRIVWNSQLAIPDHPHAAQGVLDLRSWDFKAHPIVKLDGQWEFYPGQFVPPGQPSIANRPDKQYIQVPGSWTSAFPNPEASYRYGTYRLQVLVPDGMDTSFGIRTTSIRSASKLFVNGHLVGQAGNPAADEAQYVFRNIPYSGAFTHDGTTLDIILHTANPDFVGEGGVLQSIRFGEASAVSGYARFFTGSQLAVCLILLIHAIYAVLLYFIVPKQKLSLSFALLLVSATVSILVDDEKPLLTWFPFSYEWSVRLIYLSYTSIAVCLLQLGNQLFPLHPGHRIFRLLQLAGAVYIAFIMIAPASLVSKSLLFLLGFGLLTDFIFGALMLHMVMRNKEDSIFLLLGITAVVSSVLWGCMKNIFAMDVGHYPFDMVAALMAFASYWFKRYFRASTRTESLAIRLQREDKRKDEFLANTSHELRNPLHGILNIAQTVLTNEQDRMQDSNKKHLELLITVSRRMSYLLNDLLDMTRLKEGRIRLHLRDVDVRSVASGTLDMLRFMTDGKPIQLRLEIPDAFPYVVADENRLVQMVFNLVHNAIKFTNEGSITIGAYTKNRQAFIYVADTGRGIDQDAIGSMFQPYEQAEEVVSATGGGLGLGLSICKQLVELHGGTLTASSVPGQGSVFTFSLPLGAGIPADELSPAPEATATALAMAEPPQPYTGFTEAAPAAAPSSASFGLQGSAAAGSEGPNLLVVDDDPVNLKILEGMLSSEGYSIHTAANGTEALSLLRQGSWNLVIADVMMPQMSGYELTRTLRARYSLSELPILLLTARSNPEDITTGFMAGANDYVIKPVESYDLQARVRSLLDLKLSIEERLRMEAAWLQAQIKPHFFFNTINSISVLSDLDTEQMKRLLETFADYLQQSFDFRNSRQLVPLRHELDLVQSYLSIESVRFGPRLAIRWEVEESLDFRLPPLSIQPLVENALVHGILQSPQGGTVIIRITSHQDYAEVEITDNGPGMSKEQLASILDGPLGKERGIGLFNTDRRLKHLYGEGLSVRSIPGEGTSVMFRVYPLALQDS
ncbi:ATP-binding protein [Paenibacillus sp. NPDC056579]|uniref:hybrid sensor histidine kinase/response regulator n=1 Tax=Paenibacillus sp. NPDC056579 TaxID=3345871 RepID=UPI0036C0BF38